YSDFNTPGQINYVTGPPVAPSPLVDWRSAAADTLKLFFPTALEKVALDRSLPSYPHQGGPDGVRMINGYHGRYDNPNAYANKPGTNTPYTQAEVDRQYKAAQQARQDLAADIYRRLLLVTGAPAPSAATLTNPTDKEMAPLRWLGQLAVNIVDY